MNQCCRLLVVFVNLIFTCGLLSAKDYEEGSVRFFDKFDSDQAELREVVSSEKNTVKSDSANHLDAVHQKVIDENRIVSSLDKTSFFTLPVGISSDQNSSYMIVIDQASIHEDYAEFSAFMVLTNPFDGTKIRFRASNIAFSFKSGLLNGLKLELIEEKRMKLMNDTFLNWMKGCFVEWDCNGFKSLGIKGQIELSTKSFVAINPQNGKEDGAVKAPFFVQASDLQNFFISFSLPTFKKKGFDEAYFSFTNVVFDYSDVENAPGFNLPANYPGEYRGEMKNLWQGFYVKEAKIILSEKYKEKSGKVTTFYASNLLLDEHGLTGSVGVENLLSIDKGKLGTWPMSITKFQMSFFTGDFKSLGFEGAVIVQGSKTKMQYSAFYDADDIYHFGISPGKELSFDVFAANVNLSPNSRIDITVEHGKFKPAATLHGKISFACSKKPSDSEEKKILKIPSVEFQGMRIATTSPEFDLEYLGMASSDSLSFNKFPITLNEISYRKVKDTEGRITFGIKVNLSKAKDEGIVGETRIALKTDFSKGDWKFKGLAIEKLSVEASKDGAYKISGSIEFAEGDKVYGDGFRGEIAAVFSDSFEMEAIAVFGKVNGYRYFFVDGFVCLGTTGVPAGPFVLQGFGGGLYYKMRQAATGENASSFGESLSGLKYLPDKNASVGIKAGVKAGVVNEKIINTTINFEIIFNNRGGINQIGFFGEAKLLSAMESLPVDKMKEVACKAAKGEKQKVETSEIMRGTISILRDFSANIFHSEIELYVNVAGQLKGSGPDNRAGWGVMHMEPGKWYLHLGTPTDPMGLNFIGLMKVGGYFMAGDDIPDVMVMNPKVMEYLNISQNELNGNRQDGQLNTGKGVAFGAHFSLDTGDLKFLIFYAKFELGGGFDVMLLDYGKYAHCKGSDGTLGMNGWYAKGQAYAYFGGKIGIKVKVFRKRRKFEILDIRTAACIRVEGPSPTFMKGIVGGRYRLLGGLVKGNCKFEATVGKQCEIVRSASDLADMEIIGDITPVENSEKVDLFTLPQVVFNMPVDKIHKISDDEKLSKEFKINLEEYSVFQDGQSFSGQIEWNGDHTVLAFAPDAIFNPNTKYKVVVKISFDERTDGQWTKYKDEGGQVYFESKEIEFTTGDLPDEIPSDYISYSYPINRQANFYPKEYSQAYVTFKSDVAPFFKEKEEWKLKVKWSTKNNSSIYTDLNYTSASKTVECDIPLLQNSQFYKYELVRVPVTSGYELTQNVNTSTTTSIQENETTVDVTTRTAEGNLVDNEETSFYKIDFKTSRYNRFYDRIKLSELEADFTKYIRAGVEFPGLSFLGEEAFDAFEVKGKGNCEPLIQMEAVLETNDWYQQYMNKILYSQYPFGGHVKISHRNTSEFGFPPTRPIDIKQSLSFNSLSDSDIEQGSLSNTCLVNLLYVLPDYWAKDYVDIRNQLANKVAKGIKPSVSENKILRTYPWPQVGAGNYPIRIKYVLPGRKIVTTDKILNLKNTFKTYQINVYD